MQPPDTPFQDATRIVWKVREAGEEPFDPESFNRLAAVYDLIASSSREDLVFREFRNTRRGTPSWAFVHPSTYVPGRWRYTTFDTLGWQGHEDHYDTFRDAAYAMFRAGFTDPQPGVLDDLMKTERWKIGMKNLDLVGRRNRLYAKGRYEAAESISRAIVDLNEKLQEID